MGLATGDAFPAIARLMHRITRRLEDRSERVSEFVVIIDHENVCHGFPSAAFGARTASL